MTRLFGLLVAVGIVLGHAASADAQVALTVGNPYLGTGIGIGIGQPYGASWSNGYAPSYGGYSAYSAAPFVGTSTYSSGYAGFASPGITSFGPPALGAYGLAPASYSAYSYSNAYPLYGTSIYGAAPYYGYGMPYGYGIGARRLGGRLLRW